MEFDVRGQRGMDFFTGVSIIMDYGLPGSLEIRVSTYISATQ